MKIFERIMDGSLRQEVTTGRQQLGCWKGLGTTGCIFSLLQVMEKYRETKGSTYVFIDLEKANDGVPREQMWRNLQERAVPENCLRMIKKMYRSVKSKVRSALGSPSSFEVNMWLPLGSVMSPFLFNITVDVITQDVREDPPRRMLCADDIVLCSETREELERKLENWREVLKGRGMKISETKGEYMTNEAGEGMNCTIRLNGEVKRVEKFKYLGTIRDAKGDMEKDLNQRIQAGWDS